MKGSRNQLGPTAEELIVAAELAVRGKIGEYHTTELKAAAKRIGDFICAVEDKEREPNPEDEYLGTVIESAKHTLDNLGPIDPFKDRTEHQRDMEKYQDFLENPSQRKLSIRNDDIGF